MSKPNQLCIKIDVSKALLGISAFSDIKPFSVTNDADGFRAIITELK
ncbi:MAG: hypothetical protein LBE52_08215 [Providencia sp.]|jgi:transposase|nr:hypothetical protein [Providencia sp.]